MRGPQQDGFIPLTSGAYASRSLIADAQRCINLIPELNPEETNPPAAVTHYMRNGLKSLGNGPPVQSAGRGVFTASNGNLFGVVGGNVYYIDTNWKYTLIGQIPNRNTPVSLADNGQTAVIVDGSAFGWQFALGNNAWGGQIVDPTGTFAGSVRADYTDTFLTFANPGTNQWTCSLGLQVAFNALQVASADSYPDAIITHAANLRQIWLLKEFTTEIWWLSGATPFPFEEWPNVFVPYGIAAPYSLVRTDSNLAWISRNKDGQAMALINDQYAVKVISTRALDFRWQNYQTVKDCIGYSYQQNGHTIIVFSFPTANESWGYDLSTRQWHQRAWIDNNGKFNRDRVAFHAIVTDINGYANAHVGMDWATGQIYAMDENTFTDNGQPIVNIRSFPHVTDGLKNVTIPSFVADIATGSEPGTGEINQIAQSAWNSGFSNGFGPLIVDESPQIAARLSRDGGATWGNWRKKGFVSAGHYRSMMRWRSWGMGRDLVYELAWAAPFRTALQGAYIDPIRHAA